MKKKAFFAIAILLVATCAMASSDPFAGRWRLDVRHSKYPSGTCPKSMVIEIETAGDGISYHSDTTYSNGAHSQAQYTARYNGMQAIVASSHGVFLPVSLKRVDPRTVEASYFRGLQVVARSRRMISGNGSVMKITTNSMDKSGKSVTTVGVYKKEN
jgi:hypothetical protein